MYYLAAIPETMPPLLGRRESRRLDTHAPPAAWLSALILNEGRRRPLVCSAGWGARPGKVAPGALGDPPHLSKDLEV